jgi:DNA-binding GntR family transcriptional regulator
VKSPLPGVRVRSVERVHARLRKLIEAGTFPPGAVLSQVQLAREFGVSRTPLREAMRRLEAEGLILSEANRRARVVPLDAESLDVAFTDRILLEATGITVTVPRLTETELNALLAGIASLRLACERDDDAASARARGAVHRTFVARAGRRLREAIRAQFTRSENLRRLYVPLPAHTVATYADIAGACIARDAASAVRLVAAFEAELAGRVLARIDARYEPVAIGVALQMLGAPR